MSIVESESGRSDRSGRLKVHHGGSRSGGASHWRHQQRRLFNDDGSHQEELLPPRDHEVAVEMEMMEDSNWRDSENVTCVTGNTSERSVSYEELRQLHPYLGKFGDPGAPFSRSARFRCSTMVGTVLGGIITTLAFLSPISMVVLPRVSLLKDWEQQECAPDCEGLLISFGFKLLILAFGIWALFFRRSLATMPRVFVYRSILLALVFLVTFAYWLFYGVRIFARKEPDYKSIVTFSLSLVDALLFIHYLAVILLEVRHLRKEFRIELVRSPDGDTRIYSVGQLSIQRAAVVILQNYYRDFRVYNPYLDRLPAARGSGKKGGSQTGGPSSFKVYNVDDCGHPVAPIDPQAIMAAAARKRDSGHNARFYEEIEWERRVKKRRSRLITAAEEAFGHVKRLSEEKGPCAPMAADAAAQAVFPALRGSLQRYLRVTRQMARHSAQHVSDHLATYLTFDMSPRSFLERFFSTMPAIEGAQEETQWSIVCPQNTSRPLVHGLVFQLRCHTAGPDAGVFLLATVSRLPYFDVMEEVFDAKNNQFVLRLNSETSV